MGVSVGRLLSILEQIGQMTAWSPHQTVTLASDAAGAAGRCQRFADGYAAMHLNRRVKRTIWDITAFSH